MEEIARSRNALDLFVWVSEGRVDLCVACVCLRVAQRSVLSAIEKLKCDMKTLFSFMKVPENARKRVLFLLTPTQYRTMHSMTG